MVTGNIRIRAICNDQSIYSCDVSLGSFHGTKDSVNCKGLMKLYPSDKSLKNLHVHVVMCIFNTDHMHPTIFQQSTLAVNRNIQADCCRMNQKTQTGGKMRHAATQKTKNKQTQVKERVKYVTTKDAAIQLSTRISQQQMTEIIAEIISQVLKADKKRQESRKYA
ncbi:unnamed protein product, partial [Onchocerca ochengi]|uniref:FLYWCH-type domain-containing protein n=1 Tax=Onchocerca ochengi TaxID=42157 RepID=A0A182EPE8_ONCOC